MIRIGKSIRHKWVNVGSVVLQLGPDNLRNGIAARISNIMQYHNVLFMILINPSQITDLVLPREFMLSLLLN